MSTARYRFELLALVLCTGAYFLWYAQPLIAAGTDNGRLVWAIFLDEGISLDVIRNTLALDTLLLQRRDYGHFYFNMALVPAFVLHQFGPVSDQTILVILRTVALLFGVATVVATFVLARRYFGSLVAWSAAILMATVPLTFLRYSLLARADTTQMFFLVAAVYCCCRLAESGNQRWLFWSAAAAGLACAAKYSGLFFLPIIWMVTIVLLLMHRSSVKTYISAATLLHTGRAVLGLGGAAAVLGALLATPDLIGRIFTSDGTLAPAAAQMLSMLRLGAGAIGGVALLLAVVQPLWTYLRRYLEHATWLLPAIQQIVLSGLLFTAAYILTAPAFLIRLDFIRTLAYQVTSKTQGLDFVTERSGFDWFAILAAPPLLTGLLVGLTLISLGWLVYATIQQRWRILLHPAAIMWLWVAIHLGILVVAIRHFSPQYLLPVVPFLIILALHPLQMLTHYLAEHRARQISSVQAQALAALCAGLVLVSIMPGAVQRVAAYQQETLHPERLARVQIGHWLEQTYPASTRIAYDYYFPLFVPPSFEYVVAAYIPPTFDDVIAVTERELPLLPTENQPDVVVVARPSAERFSDLSQADTFYYGEEGFRHFYEYYHSLAQERLGYTLVYASDEFHVYENCAASGCQGVSAAE